MQWSCPPSLRLECRPKAFNERVHQVHGAPRRAQPDRRVRFPGSSAAVDTVRPVWSSVRGARVRSAVVIIIIIIATIRISTATRCWSRDGARVVDCRRRQTSRRPCSWSRLTSTSPSWTLRQPMDRTSWRRVDPRTRRWGLCRATCCSIRTHRRTYRRATIRWASSRLSRWAAAADCCLARCPTATSRSRSLNRERLGKKWFWSLFLIYRKLII